MCDAGGVDGVEASFDAKLHQRYFRKLLQGAPGSLQGLDSNRCTIAYFCVSGLDVLNALTGEDKEQVCGWMIRLLIDNGGMILTKLVLAEPGGFRGSTFFRSDADICKLWDLGHLAMSYTALATLVICDYNIQTLDRKGIQQMVRNCQGEDGSFCAHHGGEADLRFSYCAAAICFMLGDFSCIDRERSASHILSCQTYEGGFGLAPGLEAHGGSTYCAVAALKLMGYLDTMDASQRNNVVRWCLKRMVSESGGYQGRCNKVSVLKQDSCYSFWIGASLDILGSAHFSDSSAIRRFLCKCENKTFGEATCDPLHTYLSLCGFSIAGDQGMSQRAYETLLRQLA
ncbi:hypothetical protein GUITHDRAFT_134800 [Guillardia theta CCMP2712]|uniref:Prenyltransferase alpha-alpha toroid domain-containing protein n=1 Tax=Guillardia theta (strain CCMP2712) TaxID=905079 RepID=L1JSB9_GUITC|nr:hypothetical protein GUITHDRAFT_134800 [Guillardia theta CCMP2712]EKX51327.1 hypothetical protein GUITHDRAFT_134800 [Guillardia theta CCMP2712]|eukprot:XP_005838307.1 hypothetical protein GUITHDRAFT_134800 [Guillardia theta CCMP2712]